MNIIFNFSSADPSVPLIDYDPQTCGDVIFPAIQNLFRRCGKESDGVAPVRFQIKGFAQMASEFDLFESSDVPVGSDPVWLERFCYRLASIWRFQDEPVHAPQILSWLGQFESKGFGREAREILIYLSRYGYVTEQRLAASLKERYRNLALSLGVAPIPVAFQAVGKSESKIAYRLRPEIELFDLRCALELVEATPSKRIHLIGFDDCIGSGETQENYLFDRDYNPEAERLIKLLCDNRCTLHVLVYHSDERGVSRIQSNAKASNNILVHTVFPLDAKHQTFSDQSQIIPDESRRNRFKAFCERIGEDLFPGSPLGWGNCQWCVSYDYSIPDTSLPILFSQKVGWKALFPRNR